MCLLFVSFIRMEGPQGQGFALFTVAASVFKTVPGTSQVLNKYL